MTGGRELGTEGLATGCWLCGVGDGVRFHPGMTNGFRRHIQGCTFYGVQAHVCPSGVAAFMPLPC
jgi:hypothetical protein